MLVRQRSVIQLELLLNATYKAHGIKNIERLDSIDDVLSYNSSILPHNISLYEIEENAKKGNETCKIWKSYYNDFDVLYNNSHEEFDVELSKFKRKYNKGY